MDWAQHRFKCCEIKNTTAVTDADVCQKKDDGVKSCHPDKDCSKGIFNDDCKDAFIDFVEANLVVIGAVALAIAFVQVRRSDCFKFLRLRKVYLESFTSSSRSVIL